MAYNATYLLMPYSIYVDAMEKALHFIIDLCLSFFQVTARVCRCRVNDCEHKYTGQV